MTLPSQCKLAPEDLRNLCSAGATLLRFAKRIEETHSATQDGVRIENVIAAINELIQEQESIR